MNCHHCQGVMAYCQWMDAVTVIGDHVWEVMDGNRIRSMALASSDQGSRNRGASDFVKVEFANPKQVKDAISICTMDIDFVAITGLGSKLLEDRRICELLSGGQARVYPKCHGPESRVHISAQALRV